MGRADRAVAELRRPDLLPDPLEQVAAWYDEARKRAANPDRLALATVDRSGHPDLRMVLSKGIDRRGIRFFTNYESRKASQIEANPTAAAIFHWSELDRQVRLRGAVERLSAEESDEYFATRDRLSRLGSWASPQSRVISGRDELDRYLTEVVDRFGGLDSDRPVARPDHWGGYLIRPFEIELWQGRGGRLHDRFRYNLSGGTASPGGGAEPSWSLERLAP